MATKRAGMGAAFVVLTLVFGLMAIIGVILLMMWFQPDIEHSPSGRSALSSSHVIAMAQISEAQMFVHDLDSHSGASL